MSNLNVFVTGCNRGIGLELVRQLLKTRQPKNVFATHRCELADAKELGELAKDHENLHLIRMDMSDLKAFDDVASKVSDVVGDDGLNLLINNAGVKLDEGPDGPTPEQMRTTFEINTIAPYFFNRAMLPLLKKAVEKNKDKAMGISRAASILMSTAVASIQENAKGTNYSYRSSKTALNMVMKNLSIELKPESILVMSMHPGWVKTDMGGPNALITTETCVKTMLDTLDGLTEKDNGSFLRYNSEEIPW